MRWYKLALRKHLLRMDPRIVVNATADDPNINALITSFISSAIIKGLDIAGFINADPQVSALAVKLAKNQNVDIFVLPGQSYKTADGYDVIIYNKPDVYQPGLSIDQILSDAKSNGWFTLVYNLGKQKAKHLYSLGEKGNKPTFVEIFSSKSYGYLYLQTNAYEVVSSGAESPSELEQTNIYSHVPRKDMEEMQIIPENFGTDYVPSYLEPKQQEAIS